MPHARQTIRSDVATALAAVGPTVFKMRSFALDQKDLPAICVFTSSEQSSLHSIGTRTLMRALELAVEIVIKGRDATIEDTLDDYVADIEAIMEPGVSAAVKEIFLNGTEITIDTDSGVTIATATMTYSVTYITLTSDPQIAR